MPPTARGDDRRLARHRLQVDDPERLVYRRADEDGGVRVERDHVAAWAASPGSTPPAPPPRASPPPPAPPSPRRSPACRARRRRAPPARPGRRCRMARTRCRIPFCRVMRPTKRTIGHVRIHAQRAQRRRDRGAGGTRRGRCRCGSPARAPASTPYSDCTSSFIAAETATTPSAFWYAVRSIHVVTSYAVPSCSTFHGRCGSSECVVSTSRAPVSGRARQPARCEYQVWQCTMSGASTAPTMARSRTSASSSRACRGSRAGRSAVGRDALHAQVALRPRRCSPKQSTCTWCAPPSAARQLARQVLDVDAGPAVDVRRVLVGELRDAQRARRSYDGAVRDLGVLDDDDDPVADVEAGPLALLHPRRVGDHAVAADGGVLVDDGALDRACPRPRPGGRGPPRGCGWPGPPSGSSRRPSSPCGGCACARPGTSGCRSPTA